MDKKKINIFIFIYRKIIIIYIYKNIYFKIKNYFFFYNLHVFYLYKITCHPNTSISLPSHPCHINLQLGGGNQFYLILH